MRRQLKYDVLAAAGVVVGFGIGLLFEWPLALGSTVVPAFALVALTRWPNGGTEVVAVARNTWLAPLVLAGVFLLVFSGSWEAGAGWDSVGLTGFDVAQFGLVATVGSSVGVAAMSRPRPWHAWAVAPLVGSLAYCVMFFVWLVAFG